MVFLYLTTFTYLLETTILITKYDFLYVPLSTLTIDHLLDWFFF